MPEDVDTRVFRKVEAQPPSAPHHQHRKPSGEGALGRCPLARGAGEHGPGRPGARGTSSRRRGAPAAEPPGAGGRDERAAGAG